MIRKIAFFTLAATLLSAHANAVEYGTVAADRSSITFTSKQMGVAVDGRFRKFSAALNFDPAKPAAASAKVDIDLNSIDAGSKDADDEVIGKQWFNVKAFPTASFVSSSVKALGGDRYEAAGKITIKGKSQDVTMPFTVKQEGSNATFDGSLTIKRLDFAIGEGPWADVGTVANEVPVKFRFIAAKK